MSKSSPSLKLAAYVAGGASSLIAAEIWISSLAGLRDRFLLAIREEIRNSRGV